MSHIFHGFLHTTCIFDIGQEWNPWCSTLVNDAGHHVAGQGNWGNCGPGCPIPSCNEGTYNYPCGNTQGDCDHDSECQDGLICGNNNCVTAWNFPNSADCCTNSRKISLSKHPTHNKDRMSRLRPQQFGKERKMPDSRYTFLF